MSNIRQFYFPNVIKKATIAFMNIFTDIQVANLDANGNIFQMRNVSLTFGHKDKYIARMMKEQNNNSNWSLMLPHIGITITGFRPIPEFNRGGHLLPLYQYVDNTGSGQKLFAANPYEITFSVSLLSQHMAEISMMLEQILPEFNPFKNITIKEFDFLPDFTRDIKVQLTSCAPSFPTEILENNIARIEFNLTFTMNVWIYRPLLTSAIIKSVNVDIIDEVTSNLETAYTYTVSGNDSNNFVELQDVWIDAS